MQTKTRHIAIAGGIFVVEILIATVFSNINFVRYSIGDFLVVILLYHIVKIFRNVQPFRLAVSVFLFACAVEVLQYLHVADFLKLTREGMLRVIVGTSFSWSDILMYFLGCLTAYWVETYYLFKKLHRPTS